MKSLFYSILSFVLLIQSCGNYTYYLDKKKLYAFEKDDTLVYSSRSECDTFIVALNFTYLKHIADELYYEEQKVTIKELTNDCQDSVYNYCSGMSIDQDAKPSGLISFRDRTFSPETDTFSVVNYVLGRKTLNGVYRVNFLIPEAVNKKSIQSFYYTYKYGIIAYKLLNGNVLELNERYIK